MLALENRDCQPGAEIMEEIQAMVFRKQVWDWKQRDVDGIPCLQREFTSTGADATKDLTVRRAMCNLCNLTLA